MMIFRDQNGAVDAPAILSKSAMSGTNDLIDVHAHFTTPHYMEVAKAAGHLTLAGMPEAYWPQCWLAVTHRPQRQRPSGTRAINHAGDGRRWGKRSPDAGVKQQH